MKKGLSIIVVIMLLCAFGCANKTAAIADGAYAIGVTLEGGSGRASIESPAKLSVQDGKMTLSVVWSSDKYDYMLVGGEKLLPEIVDGHSVFQVPVDALDAPLKVVADTTAMSTPHEIEYTITFDAASLTPAQ